MRSAEIYIRENGQNRKITREDWDQRFPGTEPVTINQDQDTNCVFEYNITHNLNKMANEAGLYEALWRPDEIGAINASQLIEVLQAGLERLRSNPECYRQFNPSNGWGDYEGLVDCVKSYLTACRKYPDAKIRVSR
jgi:hypothetical protein